MHRRRQRLRQVTLLNLVAGLDQPSAGSVETNGHRVAFMFQEASLFPWLTVNRNVELALKLRKVPKADRADRVAELLELVRLGGRGNRRPHELSGGMRQRAALARVLAQDADVLLMDEPFAALDAMTRDTMHDEIERIWTEVGLTILFVTHNVREAVRLSDRTILMESGPGRVKSQYRIDLPRPRHQEDAAAAELSGQLTHELKARWPAMSLDSQTESTAQERTELPPRAKQPLPGSGRRSGGLCVPASDR